MVEFIMKIFLMGCLGMISFYYGRHTEKDFVLKVLKHCMHQPKHLSFNSSGEMYKANHDVLGAFRKFYGGI